MKGRMHFIGADLADASDWTGGTVEAWIREAVDRVDVARKVWA